MCSWGPFWLINHASADDMNPLQRRRLIERHRDSLNLHGYAPDALFWQSRGLQKVLFRVLADIGVSAGDSLLDVGCGFADLHSWLRGHDLSVDYTGIDLSPEILATGARMNPGLNLLCGELFDFAWPPRSFDWVVLSGTLNWNLHDDGGYARRVITRMFELCRQGVAFNMLDARKFSVTQLGDMQAYDPGSILEFCATLTPDCRCRSDYLPDDFTIYMRRA
ncbi:SAM-dependent methyltransferase [Mariprofundus ferrooxydans]|nr:SAM-dependent methyltransferase [Mariprofundus ferrooxydans]